MQRTVKAIEDTLDDAEEETMEDTMNKTAERRLRILCRGLRKSPAHHAVNICLASEGQIMEPCHKQTVRQSDSQTLGLSL